MRAVLAGVSAHPKAVRVAVANVTHAHAKVFGLREHPKTLVDGGAKRKDLFDLSRDRRFFRICPWIIRVGWILVDDDVPLPFLAIAGGGTFGLFRCTVLKEANGIVESRAHRIKNFADSQIAGVLLKNPVLRPNEIFTKDARRGKSEVKGAGSLTLDIDLRCVGRILFREIKLDRQRTVVNGKRR